jgi:hypothetical protein
MAPPGLTLSPHSAYGPQQKVAIRQLLGDVRTLARAWGRSAASRKGDVAGGNAFGPAITGDRCEGADSRRRSGDGCIAIVASLG